MKLNVSIQVLTQTLTIIKIYFHYCSRLWETLVLLQFCLLIGMAPIRTPSGNMLTDISISWLSRVEFKAIACGTTRKWFRAGKKIANFTPKTPAFNLLNLLRQKTWTMRPLNKLASSSSSSSCPIEYLPISNALIILQTNSQKKTNACPHSLAMDMWNSHPH